MSLQFYLGSAGAGKSRALYQNLIMESEKHSDENFIAVVPEQYSMEAQKEILELHKRHGSFNIEVTSFNRLAYQVFGDVHKNGINVMTDTAKSLIVRKILNDVKSSLKVYRGKTEQPGFNEKVKMIISEFKQYNIGPKEIADITDNAEITKTLVAKLGDISTIICAFDKYIEDKGIVSEDVLKIMCACIPDSGYIKHTHIYIDGYTGFTPSQYDVLKLLLKYAPEVKIAVTLPYSETGFSSYDSEELFAMSKETISKIKRIASEISVNIRDDAIIGEGKIPYRIQNNPGLGFLERNLFRNEEGKEYKSDDKCDAVGITCFSIPKNEVEYVAKRILYLVRNKGYRYRDFAVITGDMSEYGRHIEEVFGRHGIPCFVDMKKDISKNPFADTLVSALNILEKDFSYDSVFHFLKLGVCDIDLETRDIMENYVIRSGRRGKKSYSRDWTREYDGFSPDVMEAVNKGRRRIYEIISGIKDDVDQSGRTVLGYTRALYKMMQTIDMKKRIDAYVEDFENKAAISGNAQKYLRLAREYKQIYSSILEMFETMCGFLGDEKISRKDYIQLVLSGLESIKIGVVPPGIDMVMAGDITRTRLKDTKKIIFLIGVNDGIIPDTSVNSGILTDNERERLALWDYELAPTGKDNIFRQKFYLYSIFAKPTERIELTYAEGDAEGKEKRRSYLIDEVLGLFDGLKIKNESDLSGSDVNNEKSDLPDPKDAETRAMDFDLDNIKMRVPDSLSISEILSGNLRELRFNRLPKSQLILTCGLYLNIASDNAVMADDLLHAVYYRRKGEILSPDKANALYGGAGPHRIKATAVENYGKCAFSQFLKTGLRLSKRQEFSLETYDLGNLYHDSLQFFFEHIEKNHINILDMEKNKEIQPIIESCVDRAISEYDLEALNESARNRYIKNRVYLVALRSAEILIRHLNMGNFKPYRFESNVDAGRIDRVDRLDIDNDIYVRVIDYKSGNKQFKVADTLAGTSLQLMLYLRDEVELLKKKYPRKEIHPAGAYYFHMYNPALKVDAALSKKIKKKAEEEAKKQGGSISDTEKENLPAEGLKKFEDLELEHIRKAKYKMSGVTSDEPAVIDNMRNNTPSDYSEALSLSDMAGVSFNKDGSASKASMSLSEKQLEKFADLVYDMADDMRSKIYNGDIRVNPYEDSCTYCDYRRLCRFDQGTGDRYRVKKDAGMQELREMLDEMDQDGDR